MSYLYVLEKIEDGRLTVQQAIKEIEKESKRRQKHRAKKIKLFISMMGREYICRQFHLDLLKVFLDYVLLLLSLIKRLLMESLVKKRYRLF